MFNSKHCCCSIIIKCYNRKVKKKGSASLNNIEIRKTMKERRLFNYELAEALGISEFTLSRKLRKELPQEEKDKILQIIDQLAKEAI